MPDNWRPGHLYYLAAEPEHAAILGREVDAIVEEGGWTKASIDRMCKVDSFLHKLHRLNGLAVCVYHRYTSRPFSHLRPLRIDNMIRVALTDFRLSNNLVIITACTAIAIPMFATHHDETIYPDPHRFDPYRSARLRETNSMEDKRLVKASPDFLPMGYGKHAWYVLHIYIYIY
jgi:hypothetical protein